MSQFFRPEHFGAFHGSKPTSDNNAVDLERLRVADRLLELDSQLWPMINEKVSRGLWNINHHWQRQHFTSSHCIIPNIAEYIHGMWFHYGKSQSQIKEYNVYAFYRHTRIEIFIGHQSPSGNNDCVRCWLISKDNDFYDRRMFLQKIWSIKAQENKFYSLLVPLFDKGFFYEIDAYRLPLVSGTTQAAVVRFLDKCKRGTKEVYSGIVKEYEPSDPRIDESCIVDEMWENIQFLYPIYSMMTTR